MLHKGGLSTIASFAALISSKHRYTAGCSAPHSAKLELIEILGSLGITQPRGCWSFSLAWFSRC